MLRSFPEQPSARGTDRFNPAPHCPQALPFPQISPLPALSSEQLNIYQPACPTFPAINPPIKVSWDSSGQSHLLVCVQTKRGPCSEPGPFQSF